MFCPNCGSNNSTEQKFCRSCGLNLEKSAESLVEQMPSAQSANLLRHEKAIERFGSFALGGLGVVGIIGIAALSWILVTKVVLTGTNVFAAVLLISFFVFAILSLVFVVLNESLKEKKAKANPVLTNELNEAKNMGKLLGDKPFEPSASVVENSTELLYAENKTQKF
ncbi:MAG: zinc ribbon domain-containing protein [Acidobacteriota bacterium]|nr:zinc ribbon domain-containing protein [Acidobacteriota bacterium]